MDPSTKAKYKYGTYQQDTFRWVSNIDLKIITYKNREIISSNLQSYLVHWYHTYLIHPGMDITEAMIRQHLQFPNIRDAIQKESSNFDTFQRTEQPNVKYGKLPTKLAEEILWNKLSVDIIGTYVIQRRVKK